MTRMTMQAAVTMGQLQKRLDVIGHNVANINTNGYKTRESNFSSLLSQQLNIEDDPTNEAGRLTPEGLRMGTGAMLGHTNINLDQGSIQTTNRGLDIALLEPNHMFQLNVTENGIEETRYTRSGNFYLQPMENDQVMLSTSDGHPVMGEDGPIMLDPNMESIQVSSNGEILVTRGGEQQVEGQLTIVEATRPRMLEATGDNMFRLSEASLATYPLADIIDAVGAGEINVQAGALEASNVDMAKQMTELTQTQRAYQFNGRTVSMHDQMKGLINQLR
ncbi:flagellar hook-basal body protein [Saliterribacillus persicus]|uniref:Flagellar basal-body rod protein FlgG n=1 Tax=Saliterribacillus persicus TaxID=930114 RepID=A0A368YEW4_9BACI|nr:flagellar hook-basal body protein [Saliterribacillus persicus]RCW77417.1 flagellar basal-body rod protein FlgG [Saliterribacillus persicus]